MSELISVGLDVGTTTTQMVVSKLTAENRASSFSVPRMEITDRKILYQSPIHFTPLIRDELIDGEGIRAIVEAEYAKAGITPDTVDTGAVIITGETSRKENAESVLHALSQYAGDFVVATAGPDLESVLAAKGAGALEASQKGPVLHIDIGGGTSNLALCEGGKVAATGCLNVGGRLLKFDPHGNPTYISPVLVGADTHIGPHTAPLLTAHPKAPLEGSCHANSVTEGCTDSPVGARLRHIGPPSPAPVGRPLAAATLIGPPSPAPEAFPRGEGAPVRTLGRKRNAGSNPMLCTMQQAYSSVGSAAVPLPALWATLSPGEGIHRAQAIARYLTTILEMAAGLREKTPDYYHFLTPGTQDLIPPKGVTISFSGGVADCIQKDMDPLAYGDLGPLLGKAIQESRLCQGPYRLGEHTIRATVIGAGCHSAQLSGSTIFCQNTPLPLKNLPVAVLTAAEQSSADLSAIIQTKLSALDAPGALFLPGWVSPPYRRITALADILKEFRCPIITEADMAKALGNALALRLPENTPILCIDGLSIPEGSYLDIGAPAGPSLTAIVKTLIFEK